MHPKAKLGMAVMVCLASMTGPSVAASAAAPVQTATQAGWGFIRNLQTNQCLEERPGQQIGTGGTPCRGDNDQTWQWRKRAAGGWNLVNKSTGKCLDGSYDDVYSLRCNGGVYQSWTYSEGRIVHNQNGESLESDWNGTVFLRATRINIYQQWY
jgi:hypothetical protein